MTVFRYEGVAQDRQQLRQLVDATKRARIAEARDTRYRRCAGCGVPWDQYVYGCETCTERKAARALRARRAHARQTA